MNPRNTDHDDIVTLKGDMLRAKSDITDHSTDIATLFQKVASLPLVYKLVFGLTGTMLVAIILAIMALVFKSGFTPTLP